MKRKISGWWLLIALVIPLALVACQPTAEPTEEPVPAQLPEVEEEAAPEEEVEEEEVAEPMLDPSGQTVSFWHVWGSGTAFDGLTALVDEFNATNEWGITVEPFDQGSYRDLEDAMNAAIQSGDVPNIVVGFTNALDSFYSVDATVDMNALVADETYGLTDAEIADYYEGVWNNGLNGEGARVGFPHGQSAQVMFYNHTWAQELGFDSPPATMDEMKEQACAGADVNATDADPDNDGTGGFVLFPSASNMAAFTFAQGTDFINADGTGYDFTKPEIEEVARFWKEMWDEGCAFPTESFPNPELATRKALITFSSTAGLPFQLGAFEADDAFQDDEWGFVPFPGTSAQAINAFAQNSAVVATTPEQELASWLFIKWFTSPEQNARWIESSAYHPIRKSAVDLLGDYSAANPLWAEGINLAPLGNSEPGWASWGTVRRALQDTGFAILGGTPEDIPGLLEELNATAAELLAETQ